MAIVNIRRSGSSIVYDPSSIKLNASDFIVFANYDPDASHQPTKLGEPANYWYDNKLPPYVDGQPAATSPAINLSSAGGTITYEDGLHPGSGITGTITF
jgi:plastocyanin